MTVQTPFPGRPATPFWDPRGKTGMAGLGDTATDVLNAIAAGSIAAERTLVGGQYVSTCPVGMVYNPTLALCQPGVSGTVTASGNSGLLILVGIGVLIFMMARR